MSAQLGELVDEAARRADLNDYQLSLAITKRLPDRQGYNSKQVARLRAGEVRYASPEVVRALIDILDLDPADAWHAAGILPPDMDLDDWRLFRRFIELRRTQPELVAAAERELVAITGEFAAVAAVGTGARSDQPEARKVYFSVTAGQAPRRIRHRGNLSRAPTFALPAPTFEGVAA